MKELHSFTNELQGKILKGVILTNVLLVYLDVFMTVKLTFLAK